VTEVPDLAYLGVVATAMIADKEIEDVDSALVLKGSALGEALGVAGLQKQFDILVAELVQGTADQLKGKKYVRLGLLGAARQLTGLTEEASLQEVLLHRSNRSRVFPTARQAIFDEIQTSTKAARSLQERETWEVPKLRQVELSNLVVELTKCLYYPVVESYLSNELEHQFALALDGNPRVKWWLKNGDGGADSFGIPVGSGHEADLFYPDWVVEFADGSYGLYDTKAHGKGGSASTEDAKEKSNALWRYLAKVRKSGISVEGGLVVRDDAKRWRVFAGEQYSWTRELKGWDALM